MTAPEDAGRRHWISVPLIVTCATVGLIMAGLLVGYEPSGGDPDRIFRPIKAELSASLKQGTLPYWSERLGLGAPLVAESHVAAFYPLNWLLYGVLNVSAAYRLSMWLHYVIMAAAVYAYARQLEISPWAAAVSAIAFTFCGFQTIHSSHEWAYHTLAYLPICLLLIDRFASTGELRWLGWFGLAWGAQITLGHFQVQFWTGALAAFTGMWRAAQTGQHKRRVIGVLAALALAVGVAAVQLIPTFELAEMVGQLSRSANELAFYSYPPDHWNELAVPGLFRGLAQGPEGRYWFSQDTTGYETCLFVGTVPLILAIIGFFGGGSRIWPWRVITIATLALATIPRWWPMGYVYLLKVPGFGFFRCPARYTVISSLGLCLLAGRGFDRALTNRRFYLGLILAIVYGIGSIVWAFALPRIRPEFRPNLSDFAVIERVAIAAVMWLASVVLLIYWRRKARGIAVLFVLTAIELAGYYHFAGTTRWGWSIPLPESSPVLAQLAKETGVGRVGGTLDNLPIRAGVATGSPYTGFPLPRPNNILKAALDPRGIASVSSLRWLRRFGVTHLVWDTALADSVGDEIFHGADPTLDVLTIQNVSAGKRRDWHVLRVRDVFPKVRLALRVFEVADLRGLNEQLSSQDNVDTAYYLAGEAPRRANPHRATSARIVNWDGLAGEVEHDGAIELILCRAFYPGWEVRINDGPSQPARRVDGGLLAAPLDGTGRTRVEFRYRPTGQRLAFGISGASILICVALVFVRRKKEVPTAV